MMPNEDFDENERPSKRIKLNLDHDEMNISEIDKLELEAESHFRKGQYEEAKQKYERHGFWLSIQSSKANNENNYFGSISNVALMNLKLGELNRSKQNYEELIQLQEQRLMEKQLQQGYQIKQSSEFVSNLIQLALVCCHYAKFSESSTHFRKAKNILKERKDEFENSITQALYLHHKAILLNRLGKFQKSFDHNQKSLKIQNQLESNNSQNLFLLLSTQRNIASSFNELGKYNDALESIEKCILKEEATISKQHPEHSFTLQIQSSILENLGKLELTLKVLDECLKIQEQFLGKNHPAYANSLYRKGKIFIHKHQYDKAAILFLDCFEIQKKSLGLIHPETAATINNIGLIQRRTDQFELALESYVKSKEIMEQLYGEIHPSVAVSYFNISSLQEELGYLKEALQSIEKCVEIEEKTIGKEHVDHATTLRAYASQLAALNFEKATQLFNRSLELQRKTIGTRHPSYCNTLFAFATSLLIKFETSELAVELLQECLSIRLEICENDKELILDTLECLRAARVNLLSPNIREYQNFVAHLNLFTGNHAVFNPKSSLNQNLIFKIVILSQIFDRLPPDLDYRWEFLQNFDRVHALFKRDVHGWIFSLAVHQRLLAPSIHLTFKELECSHDWLMLSQIRWKSTAATIRVARLLLLSKSIEINSRKKSVVMCVLRAIADDRSNGSIHFEALVEFAKQRNSLGKCSKKELIQKILFAGRAIDENVLQNFIRTFTMIKTSPESLGRWRANFDGYFPSDFDFDKQFDDNDDIEQDL